MNKLKIPEMNDWTSKSTRSRDDMVEVYENVTRIVWVDPKQPSASGKKVVNIFVENSKKITQKKVKAKVTWQLVCHGIYQRKLNTDDDPTLNTKPGNEALASKDSKCSGDAGSSKSSKTIAANVASQKHEAVLLAKNFFSKLLK
ncbi:uncharacterized protein LOC117580649 [Drosophila guanche]|uniref:uncharacterized protein LOC117580649 n=1 Tax=Drosophila guanche TaxID=7266 RepID=UPI00147238CE|nr:uncharacterized protein LOC117580649 [Drosophila guanche]